jgi:hypothetical protein
MPSPTATWELSIRIGASLKQQLPVMRGKLSFCTINLSSILVFLSD